MLPIFQVFSSFALSNGRSNFYKFLVMWTLPTICTIVWTYFRIVRSTKWQHLSSMHLLARSTNNQDFWRSISAPGQNRLSDTFNTKARSHRAKRKRNVKQSQTVPTYIAVFCWITPKLTNSTLFAPLERHLNVYLCPFCVCYEYCLTPVWL